MRNLARQNQGFSKGGCDVPSNLQLAPRAFESRIAESNPRGGGWPPGGLGKSSGFDFKKSLCFTGFANFPLLEKIVFHTDKTPRSLVFSDNSRGRLSNFWKVWKVETRIYREFLNSPPSGRSSPGKCPEEAQTLCRIFPSEALAARPGKRNAKPAGRCEFPDRFVCLSTDSLSKM
jgi:hypothetical protein